MNDLLGAILGMTPRQCPVCGAANLKRSTHCNSCGERIRNRNPIRRFLQTLVALGVISVVVWWQLTKGGAR